MSKGHDPPSGLPAPSSVDPLSDVLRMVNLTGALFFLVDASAPWTIELPDGSLLAPVILPRAQHVISYHVVTHGSCWGGLFDEAQVRLETGDVIVFPRGDAYVMSIAPDAGGSQDWTETLTFMRDMAAGHLPFSLCEGGPGPDRIHLVCGFLGCDLRPFNPLLATLPRLLHLRRAASSTAGPVGRLLELIVAESRGTRPGSECVRLRLSELLFVEVVRQYLASLPDEQTGWLGGLRDPVVGRALALIHDRPFQHWTLEVLAREAGVSRSVLADRFTHLVGQPPIQYLTRWRIQVAARRLADEGQRVSEVARIVGYESEAAFSRAFKKATGVSPAVWRTQRLRA